ncbi:MAG: PD40 domain-containing protein [Flavobacteriales bacterium]|nr:PD40 domain-containing protein [Flavobacteriales bacterium]
MKKLTLVITALFVIVAAQAQESFNQKFLEANTLIEENQYNVALPIWLDLQHQQPDNFNINYKVGLCYMHSTNDKAKALQYLVKAVQNTTNNYDPFSSSEKKSPVESYFYLARAYHIHYEFDNAMLNYNTFKEKISKKHYLFNEVDHHIDQCKYAKLAVENPVNIKVTNLGSVINSVSGDYSPVLSVDESTIYFTSRRVRKDSSNYYIKDINDGEHYEDIYVAHNYDGVWHEPELLGINTEGHEATVNVSVDGQTLFIYKDDDGDGNIYISKLEGDEWSTPFKLGSDINETSRETHAHISPDGNTLYFVSDRKGGLGGQDIYMCKKLPNGDWAKAQNIGNVINTPYDEDGVFIHPDGKTMYFSSKGHTSIGGYDIFFSVMDDAGNWSKPENIGYPVNSTDDDVFFVTSADGKRGYYSSFKEDGYGEKDIYQISLEDASAKPVTLLTGHIKVLGEPELPSNAQVVVTDNETGDLIGIYKPRKKDGKFSIILNPGYDYHIVYSASTFSQEEDLYIPPISAYQEINRGIDLQDVVFGTPGDTLANVDPVNHQTDTTKTTDPKWNFNENSELEKLRAIIESLNAQIADLKEKLANAATSTSDNDRVKSLEAIIEDLKDQIADLKQSKVDQVNTNYTPSGDVLASYQEYFNYNVKKVSTSDPKYVDMLNKAIEKSKSGVVTIEIESSASQVPTKTFGSNSTLAYKRAEEAKTTILNSLKAKGVSADKIKVNTLKSNVNGPKYHGDYSNTGLYEKYQYVIIKIK